MFEGFEERTIEANGAKHFFRVGGTGSPLLLLHGYPQTHVAWHDLAPLLAKYFQVILPDLRGYGNSVGPEDDSEHEAYSKRTMAHDAIEIMKSLGHAKFAICGHDRGGRVAYRAALDHPSIITHVIAIDIVPTLVLWERMDQKVALSTFHWPFLAQPAPLPESLIAKEPDLWVQTLIDRWIGKGNSLTEDAVRSYKKQFHNAESLSATCADYRAGVTSDIEHDREDRAQDRKIKCPTLIVWGEQFLNSRSGDILGIWEEWAETVSGLPLDCGHFVAEEKPEELASAITTFLMP